MNKLAPRTSLSDTFLPSLLTITKITSFSISVLSPKLTSVKLNGVSDVFHLGKMKSFQLVAKI